MRKIIAFMLLIAALGTACNAPPVTVESSGGAGEVTAITLVTPEGNPYPNPAHDGGYPVNPVEAILPTGYPELTVVMPSGEVDLGQLTPVAPPPGPKVMPSPGRPSVPSSPQLIRLIEAITADLSAETGMEAGSIEYVSATPVVWSSGGLGCPAAGTAYIEVQVEGLLVTLTAGGDMYTYHTDGMDRFVHCRDGQPISSGTVLEQ